MAASSAKNHCCSCDEHVRNACCAAACYAPLYSMMSTHCDLLCRLSASSSSSATQHHPSIVATVLDDGRFFPLCRRPALVACDVLPVCDLRRRPRPRRRPAPPGEVSRIAAVADALSDYRQPHVHGRETGVGEVALARQCNTLRKEYVSCCATF